MEWQRDLSKLDSPESAEVNINQISNVIGVRVVLDRHLPEFRLNSVGRKLQKAPKNGSITLKYKNDMYRPRVLHRYATL